MPYPTNLSSSSLLLLPVGAPPVTIPDIPPRSQTFSVVKQMQMQVQMAIRSYPLVVKVLKKQKIHTIPYLISTSPHLFLTLLVFPRLWKLRKINYQAGFYRV